jgi:hypothetical protein
MNEPIELPSLQEIEEMERQRSQAIESLEIIDSTVKCQRCGVAVPIVGKLTKLRKGNRIDTLQKRIRWLENYYSRHGGSNINRGSSSYHFNNLRST